MSMDLIEKCKAGGVEYGTLVEADGGLLQMLVGVDGAGESIPASTTDRAYAFAIDVSALKGLFLYCTGANLKIETNNATTPDHTLNMVAGKPATWHSDSPFANPFGSTDVTTLYVTNADASNAAKLWVIAEIDPSP